MSLPHGALFRKELKEEFIEALLKADMLERFIGLGPNIFYGTQLAACVMVLKEKEANKKRIKCYLSMHRTKLRVGRHKTY